MKHTRLLIVTLAALLALPALFAQDVDNVKVKDKEKSKETVVVKDEPVPDVPIKVQILLTEFDGTKKVNSLPYTIYTLASHRQHEHNIRLRFGVKVPSGASYSDVGTDIDCAAQQFGDGQYSLDCSVAHTSVSARGTHGEESEWKSGAENSGQQAILESFSDNFVLLMRDGRTMEGTSAVDPVTGHVLKVEVTLNVLK